MLCIAMKLTQRILLHLGFLWHITDMTQLQLLLLVHFCADMHQSAVCVLSRLYAYTCGFTQTHILCHADLCAAVTICMS